MKKQGNKKKKRRLNFKRIILFFLFLFFLISLFLLAMEIPIKNIYIHNNKILSDQYIIDVANIGNYPSTFKNLSEIIKRRLNKDKYIKSVKVYKKGLSEVHIEVNENYPIFVNRTTKKTILLNGLEINEMTSAPTLINIVPDTKYKQFVESMALINPDILDRISEIEYDPNDVESTRFLLYMNDDNCVYITLDKFNSLNSYLDIIKNFENKKGILHLDYGNHFTIIDNKE